MKRYIEVGEFFKRFNFLTADSDDPRDNYYYQAALNDVFWEFEFTPTADVQEVRHGKWVEENDRYYHWHCSECGYVIGPMKMDAHFCPHCGVKMDEDKND